MQSSKPTTTETPGTLRELTADELQCVAGGMMIEPPSGPKQALSPAPHQELRAASAGEAKAAGHGHLGTAHHGHLGAAHHHHHHAHHHNSTEAALAAALGSFHLHL